MAVTNVIEHSQGAQSRTDSGFGEDIMRQFTVSLDGQDDASIAINVAKAASQIPLVHTFHPTLPFFICRNIDAQAVGSSKTLFEVVARYEKLIFRADTPLFDPLDEEELIELDSSARSITIDRDLGTGSPGSSKAFLTSADEPLDYQVNEHAPVLRIRKNVPQADPISLNTFVGTTNLNSWRSYPAHTVHCLNIKGVERNHNGVKFVQLAGEFAVRLPPLYPDGWRAFFVDKGVHMLDPNDNLKKVRIREGYETQPRGILGPPFPKNGTGSPIVAPVLLNGVGVPLDRGAEPVNIGRDGAILTGPATNGFIIHPELNWAALPF